MITVFGSINLDLVTSVARLPDPGETIATTHFDTYPGGKGANQALATARAGAQVAMVGSVGQDDFAALALAPLDAAGIDAVLVGEALMREADVGAKIRELFPDGKEAR